MKTIEYIIVAILISIFIAAGIGYISSPMPRSQAMSIYYQELAQGKIVMINDSTTMLVIKRDYEELEGFKEALDAILAIHGPVNGLEIICDGDNLSLEEYKEAYYED